MTKIWGCAICTRPFVVLVVKGIQGSVRKTEMLVLQLPSPTMSSRLARSCRSLVPMHLRPPRGRSGHLFPARLPGSTWGSHAGPRADQDALAHSGGTGNAIGFEGRGDLGGALGQKGFTADRPGAEAGFATGARPTQLVPTPWIAKGPIAIS